MQKIIIRYNKILDDVTRAHALTLPKYYARARETTNMVEIREKIKGYKNAWEQINDKVFSTIESMTGKSFPYSLVNVNIVWVTDRTEAFGMIIPMSLSIDGFIMTLTHELTHLSGGTFTDEFKDKYKTESIETRVHIMIHAMTEYIWTDILRHPDYVDKHKERCLRNNDSDYIKAWEIVEKVGYKKIIETYFLK